MARRQKQHRDRNTSAQTTGDNLAYPQPDAAPRRTLSPKANEAVLHLARLLGRRIAGDHFERR